MEPLDLSIALSRLHQMAYEDGDLGAEYWNKVSSLLKEAQALKAENSRLRHQLDARSRGRQAKWTGTPA